MDKRGRCIQMARRYKYNALQVAVKFTASFYQHQRQDGDVRQEPDQQYPLQKFHLRRSEPQITFPIYLSSYKNKSHEKLSEYR